ncbi:MAG: metal-dependent transcriptional regulator [Dehalococcoidales bacterium]|nr:metal-dependent transcriptional regulator [Dehalococcoidales bacterium]
MELLEQAEEILETLWIRTEERKEDSVALDDVGNGDKKPVEQLLSAGYVSADGNRLRLTGAGKPEAMNIVRRHRLAERLLVDVLGTTGDTLMHEKACKFEHLLDRGLDESICVLLGHPRVCPHGNPIPPGKCCQQKRSSMQQVVTPLSQLTAGQKGKVAYIYAPDSNKLQKLMAMGILPGTPLSLIQNFPSYVFQVNQTQFAVDKEIGDTIYIRLIEEKSSHQTGEEPAHRSGRQRDKRERHSELVQPKGR